MRINPEGANPVPTGLAFRGNLWADTAGTMNDFSDTLAGQVGTVVLARNGYWNAGNPLPNDPTDVINIINDASAVTGNPLLPSPAALVTPVWNEAGASFGGGHATIRAAFVALVEAYGRPGAGGAGIGAADPAQMPATDILGRTRDAAPDLGAYEIDAGGVLFANGFEAG
jgi:hypothetical protein